MMSRVHGPGDQLAVSAEGSGALGCGGPLCAVLASAGQEDSWPACCGRYNEKHKPCRQQSPSWLVWHREDLCLEVKCELRRLQPCTT